VIGTRPEAIKMAPAAHALVARGGRPTLVLTGQHPQLRPGEFGLAGFPAVHLNCPGESDPHSHVGKVTAAMRSVLEDAPDLLMVQGDTSSALGAALAGFMAGVPVAHVEAGLRTHDPLLPWPEEEYRTAIDAQADLLFAPTQTAAENLRREQVRGEVHVTGNTGVDALLAVEPRLPPPTLHEGGTPRLLVTCHRRESWGAALQSVCAAIVELATDGSARLDVVLHPNLHVAEAMRKQLKGRPGISLLPPASYSELVRMIRDSDLVLSDSGGIQEEAPSLGTPLLVLRDKTERPEAIACGNARLVGTSAETIVAETRRLLDNPAELASMARRCFPFGDGRAGSRIAAIVEDWLAQRVNADQPLIRGTGHP
jgi:UDP-N-acetylglucosamine 2-epimerase (non-hydrolysing)